MANKRYVMLDIETTGVDQEKDSILQIGLLEVELVNGEYVPGHSLQFELGYPGKPENDFAKKNMVALYAKCNKLPVLGSRNYRDRILAFFTAIGMKPEDVEIMGLNASTFDLPFVQKRGILRPSGYFTLPNGSEIRVGDTHYRMYELTSAIKFAMDVTGLDEEKVKAEAYRYAAGVSYRTEYEEKGKKHEALYDCYHQLKVLNGLLQLVRRHLSGNGKVVELLVKAHAALGGNGGPEYLSSLRFEISSVLSALES